MKKRFFSGRAGRKVQQEKTRPLPRVLFALSLVFGVLSLFHGIVGANGCAFSIACFFLAVWFSLRHTKNAWGQAKPCAVTAFLLSGIALWRLIGLRFKSYSVFLCVLPAAAVLYLLWRKKLPKNGKENAGKTLKRLALLLCLLLYCSVWSAQANVCLDAGQATRYEGTIVSLTQTRHRLGTDCYARIQFEEDHAEQQLSFPVRFVLYKELQEGDSVSLLRHPGALGVAYYSLHVEDSSE